jgi:hypothetical protein
MTGVVAKANVLADYMFNGKDPGKAKQIADWLGHFSTFSLDRSMVCWHRLRNPGGKLAKRWPHNAPSIGFSGSFRKVFRAVVGLSPVDYRRRFGVAANG